MTQALQGLCAIALVALLVPQVFARLVPSTAVGRFCARLRDGIFDLFA